LTFEAKFTITLLYVIQVVYQEYILAWKATCSGLIGENGMHQTIIQSIMKTRFLSALMTCLVSLILVACGPSQAKEGELKP